MANKWWRQDFKSEVYVLYFIFIEVDLTHNVTLVSVIQHSNFKSPYIMLCLPQVQLQKVYILNHALTVSMLRLTSLPFNRLYHPLKHLLRNVPLSVQNPMPYIRLRIVPGKEEVFNNSKSVSYRYYYSLNYNI